MQISNNIDHRIRAEELFGSTSNAERLGQRTNETPATINSLLKFVYRLEFFALYEQGFFVFFRFISVQPLLPCKCRNDWCDVELKNLCRHFNELVRKYFPLGVLRWIRQIFLTSGSIPQGKGMFFLADKLMSCRDLPVAYLN